MKILYDTLALFLGVVLFFTLLPATILLIQICLVLLFVLCEILLLPICITMVYLAYVKVKKSQKTNN